MIHSKPFRRTGAVALLCITLLIPAFPGEAGNNAADKTALIKKLLTVSGIRDQLSYMKDGVLGSYSQMIAGTYLKVPDAFWDDFNDLIGKKDMDALMEAVVPVYDEHMRVEVIEKLIAMFETPFWQEWKDKMPTISREAGLVGQEWMMKITQSETFRKRIDDLVEKHQLEKLNAAGSGK